MVAVGADSLQKGSSSDKDCAIQDGCNPTTKKDLSSTFESKLDVCSVSYEGGVIGARGRFD